MCTYSPAFSAFPGVYRVMATSSVDNKISLASYDWDVHRVVGGDKPPRITGC